jgi:hypothetical protein
LTFGHIGRPASGIKRPGGKSSGVKQRGTFMTASAFLVDGGISGAYVTPV